MNPIVTFESVHYQVENRRLVEDVTFQIQEGEMIVLLGRSGSGKTTTLKLMNSLLLPTSGQVKVAGNSTQEWNPIQLRRQMGYVIQEIGLFPHLTVAQNVGTVPSLQGWGKERIRDRTSELLHLVGLDPQEFAKRYPHQLSGGQRQRVGVARALAADPPILLMDEPFGALDPVTRWELQQEIRKLQQQLHKTIIFVTHDIQEALNLASRIGLMHQGKLELLATPQEFLKSTLPEVRTYLKCLEIYQ